MSAWQNKFISAKPFRNGASNDANECEPVPCGAAVGRKADAQGQTGRSCITFRLSCASKARCFRQDDLPAPEWPIRANRVLAKAVQILLSSFSHACDL